MNPDIKPDANLRNANLCYADLHGADLRDADLRDANLRGADLHGADLHGAGLRHADLRYANLRYADLRDADLRHADLHGADLRHADLHGANLRGAGLRDADLRYVDLRYADLHDAMMQGTTGIPELIASQLNIVPEGTIIGWKKCQENVIVKLEIPADAMRSNATGRKCRASMAKVIEVIGGDVGISRHDDGFRYEAGATVVPSEPFDEDRWNECAPGIHFFLTRAEAEVWA